ncbi:MAG: hypothetical protein ACK4NX_01780, partial [Candidatus Paceibacteria bacterium]
MSTNLNLLNNKVEYVNYEEPVNDNYEQAAYDELATSELWAPDVTETVTETVYKKAVRWVLLIGTVLMPLFFLPWTTSVLELNKQLLLAVVAGAGLVLWLLDVVMSGKLSWRFNMLEKGVLAFAGAVALSTIFSISKYKSLMGMAGSLSDSLLSVVSLALVFFLIVNSFDDGGKRIKKFFLASLNVAVLYGLLQIFGVQILSVF